MVEPSDLSRSTTARIVWDTADKFLRNIVDEEDYGDYILPFTVLRRLECMLADTKEQVTKFVASLGNLPPHLIDIAVQEMERSVRGSVLVIEDEAIIAMDIADIVEGMGHRVTANARTHAEAVNMAGAEQPDLILADIQLADNSSGVEAVNEILAQFGDIPVIFITAFPERLLTGDRPEPAFLINKPYTEEQVRSAVSQAMFFSSTDSLRG